MKGPVNSRFTIVNGMRHDGVRFCHMQSTSDKPGRGRQMGNADGPYHAIEIVALVDLANQLCATIDDNAVT